MKNKRTYLCLDVGARRVGVAIGDSIARLATPVTTVIVDGQEVTAINNLIAKHDITDVIAGLPRDQSGVETQQTESARHFIVSLALPLPVHWQDESVTSIMAEDRLKQRKKGYTKEDIDAEAAAIILQDFFDQKVPYA